MRAEIAVSNETAAVLAKRYGITKQTVNNWKHRKSVADLSHTSHRLQTQLSPAQEVVVVHLRSSLLLPLDDLLAVTREFICDTVSRSGLNRCLRRHGVGNLNALKPKEPQPTHKALCAHRCEVPAPNARSGQTQLFVCGHRQGYALGIHTNQEQQDSRQCQGLFKRLSQGLPNEDHQNPHR